MDNQDDVRRRLERIERKLDQILAKLDPESRRSDAQILEHTVEHIGVNSAQPAQSRVFRTYDVRPASPR
jgi:hypothetical protein